MTSHPYMVEMKVTKRDGTSISVTSRQYAYTVGDAYVQAAMIAMSEHGSNEVSLLRIGPPEETYATDLVNAMKDALNAAMKVKP